MQGLLADVNIEGQLARLIALCQTEPWREIWEALDLSVATFHRLMLSPDVRDSVVWRSCQQRELVLVTGNRNMDDADSLESVIRTQSEAGSLPVITLANPQRIMRDRAYARRVAESLLEHLVDIDRYRGTGRIFLP